MKDNTDSIEGQVSQFGSAGHVLVPKLWIGKKVKVSLIESSKNQKLK